MDKICFIVCPIGSEDSETRKNSDDLMEFVITPVCDQLGYEVVRADKILSNDKIDETIINYLQTADLVIADVSDNNANVFYELGYRTATSKPVIQIATECSKLPFDINTIRTHFYNLSDPRKCNDFKESLLKIINQVETENQKRLEKESKNQMDEVFTPDFQRSLVSTLFSAVLENPEKFKNLGNKDVSDK